MLLFCPEAKVKLEESKLPSKVLHAIWNLSDVDKDWWFLGAKLTLTSAAVQHEAPTQLQRTVSYLCQSSR